MSLLDSLGNNNQAVGIHTGVDLIFVIDATGSMEPILSKVKENALSLYDRIVTGLRTARRTVKELRIKVIVYRDFYVDTKAIETSEHFFVLPDEKQAYHDFINSIQPMGGGDEPESALEALYYAMRSEWSKKYQKRRHIIVVLTDASGHKLDNPQRQYDSIYPSEIPHSLSDLQKIWVNRQGRMTYEARRMAIFAPNSYPWNEVGAWGQVQFTPSKAGEGLSEMDMDTVINYIVASI